ncbi:hypothetical protein EW145_g6498 [Phellinidium pouzarii]|uniref:Uncharacterized protein n=1 Tax=Phellinidium pouzarii TaxID=167371 RepID=A0A4S4KWG9_9AGAM|nr:hypothetical protein EW145_g6498 [Phellinidium pouzarii]
MVASQTPPPEHNIDRHTTNKGNSVAEYVTSSIATTPILRSSSSTATGKKKAREELRSTNDAQLAVLLAIDASPSLLPPKMVANASDSHMPSVPASSKVFSRDATSLTPSRLESSEPSVSDRGKEESPISMRRAIFVEPASSRCPCAESGNESNKENESESENEVEDTDACVMVAGSSPYVSSTQYRDLRRSAAPSPSPRHRQVNKRAREDVPELGSDSALEDRWPKYKRYKVTDTTSEVKVKIKPEPDLESASDLLQMTSSVNTIQHSHRRTASLPTLGAKRLPLTELPLPAPSLSPLPLSQARGEIDMSDDEFEDVKGGNNEEVCRLVVSPLVLPGLLLAPMEEEYHFMRQVQSERQEPVTVLASDVYVDVGIDNTIKEAVDEAVAADEGNE